MIFLVSPFMTDAAPSKNKAKQTDPSQSVSKKHKSSAKQSKSRVAKKDSKNKRNSTKGQITEARAEAVTYENDGEYIEYKVKSGDTIDKIATLFSVEKDELIETNELASKKKLSPGKHSDPQDNRIYAAGNAFRNSLSFSSNSIARYLAEIIFVKALFSSIFIFD